MIIAIMGASGSGKSTIESMFQSIGCEKIIITTTRLARVDEQDGVDYHFVDVPIFEEKIRRGEMLEWDLYSQNRYYGIAIDSIPEDKNSVVVVTPNGYRALKKLEGDNVIGIYLTASLGNRMIRYIQRCGADKFNYDDKNELCARVERDYGMFLGIVKEADIIADTNTGIHTTMDFILEMLKRKGVDIYALDKKDISL